jgi:hypothetical protein
MTHLQDLNQSQVVDDYYEETTDVTDLARSCAIYYRLQ